MKTKPTIYTEEIAKEIIMQVMEGKSLRKICEAPGMPGKRTVFDWLSNPDMADFTERYSMAKSIMADVIFDEVIDIADEATDNTNANAVRVRVDARKWVAARLMPKKYGSFKAVELVDNRPPALPDFSKYSFEELYALKHGKQ